MNCYDLSFALVLYHDEANFVLTHSWQSSFFASIGLSCDSCQSRTSLEMVPILIPSSLFFLSRPRIWQMSLPVSRGLISQHLSKAQLFIISRSRACKSSMLNVSESSPAARTSASRHCSPPLLRHLAARSFSSTSSRCAGRDAATWRSSSEQSRRTETSCTSLMVPLRATRITCSMSGSGFFPPSTESDRNGVRAAARKTRRRHSGESEWRATSCCCTSSFLSI
mmetsp:Transcript_22137/g.72877  ORF Transcript_22137/g.72877 Transcript_22137/m.72877 type:complete len:224 (+) Transcript_22137:528-1199(+)